MRPILLLIPISLGITPLAAQLTPEQRQAVEIKAQNATLNQRIQEEWTQGMERNANPAYNLTARADWLRLDYTHWLGRVGTGGGDLLWYAFGTHTSSLRSLHRDGASLASVRADKASVLTIATPKGGPARPLVIRADISSGDPRNGWSQNGAVTADQNGRYVLPVPAMGAGSYEVRITMYDPDHPDTPPSESTSTLVVTN